MAKVRVLFASPLSAEGLKVAVFGSGSFGTAMATVVARNGFSVVMLCRSPETAERITTDHKNPKYLTDVSPL
jgi:glycerol-3-phosphate dehydrogenase (NAD(P)+)